MFGFKRKPKIKKESDLTQILNDLCRNEISVTARRSEEGGSICRSKIGGVPAVPADFVWPRFEGENYDGETASRPLSFLCQINLEETHVCDREKLLPAKGLLLFFYELDTMRWGFDPEDRGCFRVYYFEDVGALALRDFPDDLSGEYRIGEYELSFAARDSYPSFEELECHTDTSCDWDEYDEAVTLRGFAIESERHKLLGYADLIQGEMLSECEQIARGIYCGDPESYRQLSEQEKADIHRAAADWVLLFQMESIQEEDCELMFGDVGNLYFYIRREDLAARAFDRAWLILQCG